MTAMRSVCLEQDRRAINGTCGVRTPHDHVTLTRPCAAVFFDMDGVLVDSSTQITQAVVEWSLETGVNIDGMQAEAQSMTDYDFVRAVAPHLDTEAQVRRIQDREERLAKGTPAMPGARMLYDHVPRDLRAVVTNGCSAVARTRLRSAGFDDLDVLITADDVERGKPDPEPYQLALDTMGFEAPLVVAVEDSVKGAASASKAGLFVIGYDPQGRNHELRDVADMVVTSLEDIALRWYT